MISNSQALHMFVSTIKKPDEIIYDMTDNETARQWLEDYEKEA